MDREPSLLDYLLSLLDPRRERIRLDFSTKTKGEESDIAEGPYSERKEPVLLDRADENLAPSAIAAQPESPPSGEDGSRPDGRLPWRSLLALALALIAQSFLEPPDRLVAQGVGMYLAAGVLAVWGVLSGELRLPPLPRVVRAEENFSIQAWALWAALPVGIVAFIALGGNRFTGFNLIFWLGTLVLTAWGVAQSPAIISSTRRMLERWAQIRLADLFTPWTGVLLLAAALVVFFRFHQLAQVPAEMFSDHAEKLQDVQDVLNGETRIFFPRNTGREFVQMYLTAFVAKYLHYDLTFMALKMGTALAGLAMFPFIYLLGVELAGRRTGVLAVVLAGISYWLNVITRVALRFSLYPLFVAPTLYFVVRGLRRENRNDFIWAGIFLGLGLHGYSPFRFVPILVVVIFGLYLLHARSTVDRSKAIWHLSIVVLLSLVVFLPLLRFILESEANRSIFLYRSLTRIGTVEQQYPGPPLIILAENMWRAMTMFAWDNGNTWVHSVVFRPALDVVSAALFYMGYLLLFVRYLRQRRWEDGAMVLSVPFLVLPSAMSLAFPAENPSLNRTAGAIIPVFMVAAMFLDAIMAASQRWLAGTRGRLIAWGLAGFLLFWSSFANYDLVFRQYSENFRLSAWNTSELGRVIRGFADSIGDEDHAWVIPWPHWVDTRLVGINAGVYIRDYALPREQIPETASVPGSRLYLFNTQDVETLQVLQDLYPQGVLTLFRSDVPGKDFQIFFVPQQP